MAKRGKKGAKSKTSKLVDVNLNFDSSPTEAEAKDSSKSTNKLLLDNFIALQEAMISIGANLKDLNQKITSLLELFEKAAKNFEQESQTSLTKKLSTIIEQNQTIAKSLILMNKTLKNLPQKTAELTEDDDFEGFKPSIKTKRSQKEETLTSESSDGGESSGDTEGSEDSNSEADESSEGSEDESSGFKPGPLPDFNF
ncbi:MAG: hypothetical protein NTX24_01925 [Candidatus Pacearchaeota archaeon]|nr:hypothetical protein [Candidatus Pacearchaeota archaeon]